MSEEKIKVNCPYCKKEIDSDATKCPYCNELFEIPDLKLKLNSIFLYIVFDLLFICFGLIGVYGVFWVLSNLRKILSFASEKDSRKLKIIFFLYMVLIFANILTFLSFFKFFLIPYFILEIMLSYRLLRIVEKYSLKKYSVSITHHEFGMIVFRMLYVIHYLETYSTRVYNPNDRYILDFESWIKYIIVFVLIVILIYVSCLLGVHFGLINNFSI